MGVDKPNYTQIPNLILDDIMRYMDGAELKVTLAIARQTFGYHRERVRLTISDIEGLTGLSRPAVTTAIDVGIRRGLIDREIEASGKYSYSIVVNDDVLATGKETLPPAVKKVNRHSKEILPPEVKQLNQDGKETLPKSVKEVDQNTPVLKKEKENSKEREDDDLPPLILAAWLEEYPEPMPENLHKPFTKLLTECSEGAVIHGIRAAAAARSRNFSYIAKCARNHVPEPPAPSRNGYHVELAGYAMMTPPVSPQPLTAALPIDHDDPWAVTLAELTPTLSGVAASWLTGSRMEPAGERDGKPLYRITIEARAAAGVDWLIAQASHTIRRKLGSVLGRPVLIEIVAAEMEPTA